MNRTLLMAKKLLTLFIASATFSAALACSHKDNVSSESAITADSSQTETVSTTEATTTTETSPPDKFAALYEELDTDGVYLIDSYDSNYISMLQSYGDYLLVNASYTITSSDGSQQVVICVYLYNTADGTEVKICEHIDSSGTTYCNFADDNKIVVYLPTDNKLYIYSFDGTLLSQQGLLDFTDRSFEMIGVNVAVDSDKRDFVWLTAQENNSDEDNCYLIGVPISSSAEAVFFELPLFESSIIGAYGNVLLLSLSSDYSEYKNYVYHIDTGKLELFETEGNFVFSNNSSYSAYDSDTKIWLSNQIESVTDANKEYFCIDKHERHEITWYTDRDTLLTYSYPDDCIYMRQYDLEQGKNTAELVIESNYSVDHTAYIGENQIVLTLYDYVADKSILALWDSTKTPSTEQTKVSSISNAEIVSDNIGLRNAISQKYDVTVYIGEEGDDFDCEYDAEPLLDPIATAGALKAVYDILGYFPTAMLEQLCVEPITSLQIYLCSNLASDDPYTIGKAAAITYSTWDTRYIVADADDSYYNILENLSHEIAHILDDKFSALDYLYIDYWNSFTPDELPDPYFYSYVYDSSDSSYTPYSEQAFESYEDVWFVDTYARTYPTEDRARIFENLFFETKPEIFDSEHIMDKAAYLCALIRAAYSIPDSEELYWERYVDTVSFDSYLDDIQAYDPYAYY